MSFLLIDLTKFAAEINFEQLREESQKWCYVIRNMWRLKEGDIPREETIFRELFENCKLFPDFVIGTPKIFRQRVFQWFCGVS